MFSLGNLSGILMYEEEPILQFKMEHDRLIEFHQLCFDKKKLPFEFQEHINDYLIHCFFEERITPSTRFGMNELLEEKNMYYDPEKIIRYQQGRSQSDRYWVRFE